METLMLLFVFFAAVLLAQIIAKFLYQKQEKALKSIYKTFSYITLVFLVIIAFLASTQICSNLVIGIVAFIMFVVFFTSLNIEHYIQA